MIEKSFEKSYPIGINGIAQSTLTRTANRLISEYSAVFGSWSIPDEIKDIAEKIKRGEEAEEYEYESANEYGGSYDKIYDTVKYTTEVRACALLDTDDYGDPVYYLRWYFFTSEYYTKHIAGQTIHATSHTEIVKKVTAVKGKYRYFCTHRPPSRGVIPEGYVSYDTYTRDARYIGEVTYDEQPSADALRNWGLIPDLEWERIRAAYAEMQ